jgi:hypothetical protein
MKRSIILTIVTLLLAACGSDNAPDDNKAAVSDSELSGNRGEVLSSIQVPNYTYIEVRSDGRILWLAGNPVEVEDGDIIAWNPEMVMQDFQSSALNRTFDEVVFVSAVRQGTDTAGTDTAPEVAQLEPEANSGTVRSTEKAAGYTYIELETDAGDMVWLAVPQTAVVVGNRVAWQGGSVMVNFESRSLGKTFPEILFVGGVSIGE